MTGILALVSLDGRPVPAELARTQLAAVAHRGEWEPRLWEGPGVALGHVNLPRTPEAERETLPAPDASGRYWITWDGRIDNREELAASLRLESTRAAAMTDAGYVLAAYIAWGAGCVARLLGDWAFVIWDSAERQLFCAKDPLGWRQLYYAQHDGLLAVGSEPRQLRAGGWLPREINQDFVRRFLADAMQNPGATCYQRVMELQGGQALHVANNNVRCETFWTHPRVTKRHYKQPQEYVEEFEHLFDLAVAARLRTNRPVGVYLSGGLDSSYITAIAAKRCPELLTISAHAPGTTWMDEREHAGLVASHCGVRNVQVDVSDCWSLSRLWLPDASFDQPDQPPQGATHVRLAVAARENGAGVVMGGEGADEWMTGTPAVADALVALRPREAWRIAQRKKGSTTKAFVRGAARGFAPTALKRALRRSARFVDFVDAEDGWRGASHGDSPPAWRRTDAAAREWLLYRQTAGAVIAWRDRAAFSPNGIDLRTPFNDLRIVNLMASTPEWVKQFRGRRKDILREAEYAVLPHSIPDRSDFGLYTELVDSGVGEHEAERVNIALRHIRAVDGAKGERIEREVRQWVAEGHGWWEPNWRAITAGLWLANEGVQHPQPRAAAVLHASSPTRREVISR